MARNETALVTQIVTAINRAYPLAWTFKVHGSPMQMIGVPDLLVVVDGLLFAFEVKHRKPGESAEHAYGRATPQQRLQISRLQRAGAIAHVVLSPEEAITHITRTLL